MQVAKNEWASKPNYSMVHEGQGINDSSRESALISTDLCAENNPA